MENEKATPQTDTEQKYTRKEWNKATRPLSIGIATSTVMLLFYPALLFVNLRQTHTIAMPVMLVYMIIAAIIASACISGYLIGLHRMGTLLSVRGRRCLNLISISFLAAIPSAIIQIAAFLDHETIRLSQACAINAPFFITTLIALMGFIGLLLNKELHTQAQTGTRNLTWTYLLLTICSIAVSLTLGKALILRILVTILVVAASYLYYRNWRKIIMM